MMDDKTFRVLTESFPPKEHHTNIINYESFERFETDDEYIFTLQFNEEIPENEITISAGKYHINYTILGERYSFLLTQPIIPKLLKTTFKNGILDMVAKKEKND